MCLDVLNSGDQSKYILYCTQQEHVHCQFCICITKLKDHQCNLLISVMSQPDKTINTYGY